MYTPIEFTAIDPTGGHSTVAPENKTFANSFREKIAEGSLLGAKSSDTADENNTPSPIIDFEQLYTSQTAKSTRRIAEDRSPLNIPLGHEAFAKSFKGKIAEGSFLGEASSETESIQRAQYSQTRLMAMSIFAQGPAVLEPTEKALKRTRIAAAGFYALSYELLAQTHKKFPLAGGNKCLGMVAIPKSKLVMIAISQDKDPRNDVELRKNMVEFLDRLNTTTDKWVFELASIPTPAQYLMPRTLDTRSPDAALESSVTPATRCVEVALMAALCKIGRTITFTAKSAGVIAFGGTLWASPDSNEAIPFFAGAKRNKKYTIQAPIAVKITEEINGYIDIWEPCEGHCQKYRLQMFAIGSAGGPATSFLEPRSENNSPTTRSTTSSPSK